MFFFIEGFIEAKLQDSVILSNNGLGFKLFLSQYSLSKIPQKGEKIKIYTFFYFRENQAVQTFGFISETELKLFETLISVSGIGPKTALTILSQNTPEEIIWAITQEKSEFLEKISGIGKKTSQRIILELKDKIILPKKEFQEENLNQDLEIADALASLGFSKNKALEILRNIRNEELTLEERFKKALSVLSKNKQ